MITTEFTTRKARVSCAFRDEHLPPSGQSLAQVPLVQSQGRHCSKWFDLELEVGPICFIGTRRLSPPLHLKRPPDTVYSYRLMKSPLATSKVEILQRLVVAIAQSHLDTQTKHEDGVFKV